MIGYIEINEKLEFHMALLVERLLFEMALSKSELEFWLIICVGYFEL